MAHNFAKYLFSPLFRFSMAGTIHGVHALFLFLLISGIVVGSLTSKLLLA